MISPRRFVGFWLSPTEWEQLLAAARREESTVSEVIREALYERYQLGSLRAGAPAERPEQPAARV